MEQASRRSAADNPVLTVGLITLIGLALRVWQIGRVPLWGDEAQTAVIAHWSYWDLLIEPVDPSGAFYYWLHKALIPDGASPATSRGISLVAGVLVIPLTYVTARLAIGRRAGLIAAALAALSRPLIDYSQEDRCYSLLVLLVLASAIGLLRWGEELGKPSPAAAPLVLFGGAVVLAQYTHLVAFFWSITAFHAAVSETLRDGSRIAKRRIVAVSVGTLLLLVPEALRLLRHIKQIGALGWLPQASPGQFLRTLGGAWLPFGLWDNRWWQVGDGAIVFAVTAAMLLGWMWLGRPRLQAGNPFAPTVIVGLLLFPLFVWLFGFIFSPIFMQRTILPSTLGFILVLAFVASATRPLAGQVLITMYAVAALLAGTIRAREPWSLVTDRLSKEVQSGDAIVACPIWKYPALRSAITHALPAPAYLLRRGQMLAIDVPLGSDPRWQDTFYRAILRDQDRLSLHLPQAWRGKSELAGPLHRLWLIDSQCSPEDRRMIVAWSGTGNWRLVDRWGSAETRISVFVAEEPPVVRRPVLVEQR